MGTPDEQQEQQPEELELEPETVKDLDVSEENANVRGGCSFTSNRSH